MSTLNNEGAPTVYLDKAGKKVRVGDVLVEHTGGGYRDGVREYIYKAWEMPAVYDSWAYNYTYVYNDNRGVVLEKTKFYHASPSSGFIVSSRSNLGKDFIKKFKDGKFQFWVISSVEAKKSYKEVLLNLK